MKRLSTFDAVCNRLGAAHIYVRQSVRISPAAGTKRLECITPELMSVEEVEAYRKLAIASLDWAFEKAKRQLLKAKRGESNGAATPRDLARSIPDPEPDAGNQDRR